MPKYKIYHKNGKSKIIDATDLDDAEKKATKIWKDWVDIYILKYVIKQRKSVTLNKRQYIKKSDKIYDRNKEKQKLKKELE